MSNTIGKSEGKDLIIDVSRLIETRLLIQANSGGGKSWALRRILEQTANKVQQIIIDPEGEFSTLREKFDFIVCAPHNGDALAHPRTASLLARRLLETGVSAIVDIYDLKAHERQAFVRIFLDALINAPKELWRPCLVVIDEAHIFCPEKGHAESAGAVIDLATRGRKRGFSAILATQRLSKLHKDAAAEMLNKLIGRTGLDIDVKRAADELGLASKDATRTLRDLSPGEFFAFGPALSRAVVKVEVGPVVTKHPKIGERFLSAPPAPSERIRKVLAELADLPKEAEEEARTLADLKAENTALKRDAKKIQTTSIEIKKVEVPIIKDADRAEIQRLSESINAAGKIIDKLRIEIAAFKNSETQGVTGKYKQAYQEPILDPKIKSTNNELKGPERKLLSVLAQYPAGRSVKQLALLAGYAVNGGAFRNPLGSLRSHEFVRPGDPVVITETGLEALGSYEPLPRGPDLIQYWMNHLSGPEGKILKSVIDAYPNAISTDELAQATGYAPNGGAFRNPLGRLRTLELIEGRGELRASDVFFE